MRQLLKQDAPGNVRPDDQEPQQFVDAEREYLEALPNKRNQTEFAKSEFDQLDKGKLREVMHGEKASLCVYCERRFSGDHFCTPIHSYQRIPKSGSAACRLITRSRIRAAASAIRALTESSGTWRLSGAYPMVSCADVKSHLMPSFCETMFSTALSPHLERQDLRTACAQSSLLSHISCPHRPNAMCGPGTFPPGWQYPIRSASTEIPVRFPSAIPARSMNSLDAP